MSNSQPQQGVDQSITSDQSKTPVGDVRVCAQLPNQTSRYTALPLSRQRFILGIITIAGTFGPLAGNIYLPALPVLSREFKRTETEINITVTVFMVVFAFGVSFEASSKGY